SCSALFFYFLILQRPPSSPLFPYTTLFRSVVATGRLRTVRIAHRCAADRALVRRTSAACSLQHARRGIGHHGQLAVHVRVTVKGDRKSTRLNSSHSQISYAVFCLKKKKKKK